MEPNVNDVKVDMNEVKRVIEVIGDAYPGWNKSKASEVVKIMLKLGKEHGSEAMGLVVLNEWGSSRKRHVGVKLTLSGNTSGVSKLLAAGLKARALARTEEGVPGAMETVLCLSGLSDHMDEKTSNAMWSSLMSEEDLSDEVIKEVTRKTRTLAPQIKDTKTFTPQEEECARKASHLMGLLESWGKLPKDLSQIKELIEKKWETVTGLTKQAEMDERELSKSDKARLESLIFTGGSGDVEGFKLLLANTEDWKRKAKARTHWSISLKRKLDLAEVLILGLGHHSCVLDILASGVNIWDAARAASDTGSPSPWSIFKRVLVKGEDVDMESMRRFVEFCQRDEGEEERKYGGWEKCLREWLGENKDFESKLLPIFEAVTMECDVKVNPEKKKMARKI